MTNEQKQLELYETMIQLQQDIIKHRINYMFNDINRLLKGDDK